MKNSTCCSWRIAPAADGALPGHKKGEVVSFQVSGIPLEPDGSVEADRLRILVDVQDAPQVPAGPGGHCDIVVFIVKMYLMTRS